MRDHLDTCLERLSDRQRQVFVLREVEGVESEEVCNILEVTRTNMGVLLHRARNALRDCLESHGIEGTDTGGEADGDPGAGNA